MIKIIVTGHGNYASGMISAAELIIGENHSLSYVEFTKDTSPQQLKLTLLTMIDGANEESILVLSDLIGGTPYKTSVAIANESTKEIKVIGGTNLAMLMEAALTLANQKNLNQFIFELLESSRNAMDVFEFLEETEEDEDTL